MKFNPDINSQLREMSNYHLSLWLVGVSESTISQELLDILDEDIITRILLIDIKRLHLLNEYNRYLYNIIAPVIGYCVLYNKIYLIPYGTNIWNYTLTRDHQSVIDTLDAFCCGVTRIIGNKVDYDLKWGNLTLWGSDHRVKLETFIITEMTRMGGFFLEPYIIDMLGHEYYDLYQNILIRNVRSIIRILLEEHGETSLEGSIYLDEIDLDVPLSIINWDDYEDQTTARLGDDVYLWLMKKKTF